MTNEKTFPLSLRHYGLLGLFGALVFVTSLIVLHLMSTDIDWNNHYVSDLANEPRGWLFVGGAFVHGLGNLALTLGLRGALRPGRLRAWAVVLFGLSAVGILLAALFPVDPPNQAPSLTGRVHRSIASAAFVLELGALFIFYAAFGRHRRWRRQRAVSLVLSVSAAVTLMAFAAAIQMDVAPGLMERMALAIFLVWELWASVQLIQPIWLH
ncbi:MAG: DUF998 domain-containing protein [Woeseia sp.]